MEVTSRTTRGIPTCQQTDNDRQRDEGIVLPTKTEKTCCVEFSCDGGEGAKGGRASSVRVAPSEIGVILTFRFMRDNGSRVQELDKIVVRGVGGW